MSTKHDNRGYIIVETLLIFVPFILLMLSFAMLINVVAMQSRVHYALTQTAKEMSILSYMDRDTPSIVSRNDTFDGALFVINSLAGIAPGIDSVESGNLMRYLNFIHG